MDAYKRKHPDRASHVDQQLRAGQAVRDKNGAGVSTQDMTMAEYNLCCSFSRQDRPVVEQVSREMRSLCHESGRKKEFAKRDVEKPIGCLEDALLIHLIHGIVDALCISIQLIVIIPLIIFVLRFYAAADSCQAKRQRKQNGQCGSQ